MKTLLALTVLTALAACSGPYETALNTTPTPRYAAPMTKADTLAAAPYNSAQFTKGK